MLNAGSLLVLASLLSKSILGGDTTTTTTTNGGGADYDEPPPKSETGTLSYAEWELKYGGSYLDYEDWLKGV
jgi:hypothetical protein